VKRADVPRAGIEPARRPGYPGRVQRMMPTAPRRPVPGSPVRLVAAGVERLADVELLAVVLDGGRGGAVAQGQAGRLLARAGGVAALEALARVRPDALPPRAAAAIAAAVELGRRATASPVRVGDVVRDAAAVWAHFRGHLPQRQREVFTVLLLDGKNRARGEVEVSEGTLTAALVHPREVFLPAIRAAAAALILVHNHPSGDPTPSAEDVAITGRLRQVGELVGIRVLDHVIIGADRYTSMAETGRW
jgi:DNA repair protein RadC